MTQSNYPVLLEAGARIFEFTPGFVHTKTMVADDLYASVGSCNLDYRSFYLQFENGVWLCGDPAVLSVRDDFCRPWRSARRSHWTTAAPSPSQEGSCRRSIACSRRCFEDNIKTPEERFLFRSSGR